MIPTAANRATDSYNSSLIFSAEGMLKKGDEECGGIDSQQNHRGGGGNGNVEVPAACKSRNAFNKLNVSWEFRRCANVRYLASVATVLKRSTAVEIDYADG